MASSWTPLRELRLPRAIRTRAHNFPPDRLAPMRHRHHQQPLAEPGSGTEVPSRGGQSSSVRPVRQAARRSESRLFARTRPRRLLGEAVPSMRFLDPRSRGRTRTRKICGVAVVRYVGVGDLDDAVTPRVACTARLARARAPRKFRAVLACRIISVRCAIRWAPLPSVAVALE